MKIVSYNWAIMLILYEQHFSIATQEKRSEILSDEEQREHSESPCRKITSRRSAMPLLLINQKGYIYSICSNPNYLLAL